jgi:hypothetical protein
MEYMTAGRGRVKVCFIPRALEVRVLTEDRTTDPAESDAARLPGEEEVILSDKLIDALEIVIERAGEGLWRFRGEEKIRKSL